MNKAHAPAGGWFEGKTFFFPVRVYYEDTDFSGVVYHSSYLRFMERGRSEFLRASGVPHQAMLGLSEQGASARYVRALARLQKILAKIPGLADRKM